MQAPAWDHANLWVQDNATLMTKMSETRQSSMEISARFPFSLADSIVLVHRLGLRTAAKIVLLVDPWCYHGEETPATVVVIRALQIAVDKAANDGKRFSAWTATAVSMSAFFFQHLQ